MKKNILVVRFSSLGDVVLTSATVLNLKVNFPNSHIVYLTKERYKPLVECFEGVDEIMTLPQSPGSIDHFKLTLKLDEYDFDSIVDLHGNFRSWLTRKIITADTRCVYPKRRIERLRMVKKHRLPAAWPHTIDLYNECVERLGGRVVCKRPIIKPSVAEKEISSILKPVENKKHVVVIAPGAAHPNKQWPMERFAEVAENLHRSHGAAIVWAVSATDRGQSQLKSKIPADYFLEPVDYPVDKLAGVIARADLTIANDSGIAHLSSAVGTPVVALFGPTHPALGFAPRGLFDRVVEVDEFCRPCSLHGEKECHRDKRYCFTRITPEMVYETACDLLDSAVNSSRALFVDRDGTIMVDKNFLSDPDEIEFVSGSVEALRFAKAMGYRLVVLSNQSGVARGFFGLDTVEKINKRFLSMLSAEGVQVDALYFCPHLADGTVDEFAVECDCRKPAPAMAEEAARSLRIDLRRSYVIGDKIDDLNLGQVIGACSFLVRTGHGREQEQLLKAHGINDRKTVCDDLQSAVGLISTGEGT
jgi:D,D-heptose 1,7-bisphosphate phosphatase